MGQLTVQILGIKHLALVCMRQIVDFITPTLTVMDILGYNLILNLSLRIRHG